MTPFEWIIALVIVFWFAPDLALLIGIVWLLFYHTAIGVAIMIVAVLILAV